MSCSCNNTGSDVDFSCPCDEFIHPQPLQIGAGLRDLPRQVAGFAEFRRAMLYALRDQGALDKWQARKPDDLGMMLLEMWAYICDSLSFYDKVISQEEYLRTAMRRPSLRRLVALLGYLPRPAVGASAYLTAQAEGRSKIVLPAGTAFRSGAFAGNPPQVFELDADAYIHPLTNRWQVQPPHPGVTHSANTQDAMVLATLAINAGKPLLLLDSGSVYTQGAWVSQAANYSGTDRRLYRKLRFAGPTQLPAQFPFSRLSILQPAYSTGLWTLTITGTPASVTTDGSSSSIVLDSLQGSIRKGQYILVASDTTVKSFQVRSVSQVSRAQNAGDPITIGTTSFSQPGISIPVTSLTLDKPLGWSDSQRSELTVYFGMEDAGTIADEPKDSLSPSDDILFVNKAEKPFDGFDPQTFILTDKNLQAAPVKGHVDFDVSQLKLNQAEGWDTGLVLPVDVYGNVLQATRGETVPKEILGSGNASLINQAFKLKKKPLTYLPAASVGNDLGLQNTLKVYVDNIQWRELPSFFSAAPDDAVYIVRQNDDGDSLVLFGDGLRGRRVPSGTDNITVSYRYGAGAAAPPAGVLNQIGKPVKGLRSVTNPLPAGGGADAESPERIRQYAPRSVLTLGRAVSIQDMEAIVAAVPGVLAVQGQWRWHGQRQSPVVQLWYIADSDLRMTILDRLRNVTDPETPLEAEAATKVDSQISLDIGIDPRYNKDVVISQVQVVLGAAGSGLLTPEQMGIGRPIYRSRIFSAISSVEGVLAVRSISWNGTLFSAFALTPGAGKYFDLGDNGIQINGGS